MNTSTNATPAAPDLVPPPTATARDVMTRSPISFRADASLYDLVITMARENIRHAPIVDAGGEVIGIVTDRDLRVTLGDPLRLLESSGEDTVEDLTAAHAMTGRPVVLREDAGLDELARVLIEERVGAVPVVDGSGRLVGIVSYIDLLRFLLQRDG